MKLVTAIVRPDRLDDLVAALADSGACGVTVTEVRGFGRQYGQLTHAIQAAGLDPRTSEHPVALLSKTRLDLVVHDDDVAGVIQAIVKNAGSGTIGDGKLWIAPLDSVIRVRTGELDDAAILGRKALRPDGSADRRLVPWRALMSRRSLAAPGSHSAWFGT